MNFGGISYDNKPPVENIFLKIFLEKRGFDEKKTNDNAQVNILEASDKSSEDDDSNINIPAHAPVPTNPQAKHDEDKQKDTEDESQDLLRPFTRIK